DAVHQGGRAGGCAPGREAARAAPLRAAGDRRAPGRRGGLARRVHRVGARGSRSVMPFYQAPPGLGNQYDDATLLREYLERTLPDPMRRTVEEELRHAGDLGGGRLYRAQLADRLHEPELTAWDAWGRRVDEIELTPLWREAKG